MKPGNRIALVTAAAIALAAPLACAAGGSEGANPGTPDAFAPYGEDFTRGEPIPPEMLRSIEHAKPLLFPEENRPRAAKARPRAPRGNAEGAAGLMPTAQAASLPKAGL